MGFLVILFIVLKSAIYGLSVFFTGKLTESIDVLDILALRFLLSAAVLFILKSFKVIKIEVGLRDIFKKTERSPFIKPLLLAGLFEPILYMLFETLGISQTTGITAGVILSLSPIFSCILESLFLGERNSWSQRVFLGVGIVGVIYIAVNTSTADGTNTVSGIVFMFLAVLCGCLFSVFSRKSSKHFSSFEVTYITSLLGTVSFNAANIARHIINRDVIHYFDAFLDINNIVGFLYLSVLSTIVATAMNNFALSKAKISSLSAFGGVSTIVTVAAGVLFANEKLYLYHVIGISLIIIRIIGVTYIDMKKERSRNI